MSTQRARIIEVYKYIYIKCVCVCVRCRRRNNNNNKKKERDRQKRDDVTVWASCATNCKVRPFHHLMGSIGIIPHSTCIYTKESCSNRRENGKKYEMKSKRDKINKTKTTTTTRRTRTANITERWPNLFSFLFCASDHFNSKKKKVSKKFFKIPAKLLEDFPSETKGGLVGYVEKELAIHVVCRENLIKVQMFQLSLFNFLINFNPPFLFRFVAFAVEKEKKKRVRQKS